MGDVRNAIGILDFLSREEVLESTQLAPGAPAHLVANLRPGTSPVSRELQPGADAPPADQATLRFRNPIGRIYNGFELFETKYSAHAEG
jgi:hypothetical protein